MVHLAYVYVCTHVLADHISCVCLCVFVCMHTGRVLKQDICSDVRAGTFAQDYFGIAPIQDTLRRNISAQQSSSAASTPGTSATPPPFSPPKPLDAVPSSDSDVDLDTDEDSDDDGRYITTSVCIVSVCLCEYLFICPKLASVSIIFHKPFFDLDTDEDSDDDGRYVTPAVCVYSLCVCVSILSMF